MQSKLIISNSSEPRLNSLPYFTKLLVPGDSLVNKSQIHKEIRTPTLSTESTICQNKMYKVNFYQDNSERDIMHVDPEPSDIECLDFPSQSHSPVSPIKVNSSSSIPGNPSPTVNVLGNPDKILQLKFKYQCENARRMSLDINKGVKNPGSSAGILEGSNSNIKSMCDLQNILPYFGHHKPQSPLSTAGVAHQGLHFQHIPAPTLASVAHPSSPNSTTSLPALESRSVTLSKRVAKEQRIREQNFFAPITY